MKAKSIGLWALKLIAAAIMLQTLYFKFSAHPESVQLFTTLGMEPWGRVAIGIGELIASALLLIRAFSWLGALFGAGLMAGAIFAHLTMLGISFNGSPLLFIYAVIVLVCCGVVLYAERKQIPIVNNYFR